MKPNFTLSLAFDGIRLLHRAPDGWRLVGEVALDSADLAAELAVLRQTATALEPGGLRSLLLIPDEQIKYLSLDTPGADAAARRAAAAKALEGATPYAVSDLVFDVSGDGPQTHVAAVARETLEEAEAFAVEHRFHPVAFAAVAEAGSFEGVPDFGLTAAAETLLAPGAEVEPEDAPIVVRGAATMPEGPVVDETEAAPAETPELAATPEASAPVELPLPALDEPAPEESAPGESPELAATPAETPPPVEEPLPTLDDPAPEDSAPEETPELAETPAEAPPQLDEPLPTLDDPAPEGSAPEAAPELAETPAETPPPLEEPLPELDAPTDAAPAEAAKEAPTLAPTPEESPPPRAEDLPEFSDPVTPPEAPEKKTPGSVAVSAAPLAATAAASSTAKPPSRKVDFSAPPARGAGFASRREPPAAETAPSLGGASRATPAAPADPPKTSADAPPKPAAPAPTTASVPVAAPSPAAAALAPQMPVEATEEAVQKELAPETAAAASTAAAPVQPDSSSLTPPSQASGGRFLSRRNPKPKRKGRRLTPAALAAPTAASEAERMTIFGARRREEVGGKPRFLGLILTAALLLFLAGVAAWASIFLDNGTALSRLFGDRSPETAEVAPTETPQPEAEAEPEAAQPPEATPEAENIAVLPPAPEMPDAIETAARDAGLTDEDGAVLDALRRPDPRPLSEMTEAELDARYATTGIWPRAPQVPPAPAAAVDIDDLYLTSIDPISTSTDAIALPPVTGFQTDPAPGDVASPAAAGTRFTLDARGLVEPTEEGALSPDGHLVYLGRPAAVPPATLTRPEAAPETPEADNPLAEARPRPRPDDLIETTERAQLGLTRSELAGLRPQQRPKSVQEIAAEAAEPAAPEPDPVDTSDAVAAALATPPAIENATAQATTASRRPDLRPRNFARIVERAERSAPASATVAPVAVQPRFPSKTSVAREATNKNAINLRKINLIGVYGKPSSRRALVRLSNGRYQKVEVGDRIDGGRVAAIGDSELRYVRRGRNVVLRMPN